MIMQFIKELPDKINPGKQMVKSVLGIPQNKTLSYGPVNYKMARSTSLRLGYHTTGDKTYLITNNIACELLVDGESWVPDMRPILQTELDL